MKKLALGIATAVLLATAAVPAMAQVGFYAGPGRRGRRCGRAATMAAAGYYDYYGGPGGGWNGDGWHGHGHFHGHR
jgi:hypothetical protein